MVKMKLEHCICILCKKEMENFNPSGNQPKGGTEFITHGNYGSAVTDHTDGTGYAINICDTCLVKEGKAGNVLRIDPPKPVKRLKNIYKIWSGK
jgi:hypothetical protein